MLIPATEKNFDEEGYLTANPDILKAVQSGQFESGAVHFKTIGHMEKRNILVKGENNGSYSQDGITSIHNHDFMSDPAFINAYDRGVKAAGKDYGWHWRVHIGLWAARTAVTLPGDFVECGVNAGFMSSSIMCDLDWNRRGKTFSCWIHFAGLMQIRPPGKKSMKASLKKMKT